MKRTRQTISLILCLVMLLSYLPAPVFAEGTSGSGLCQHHPVHEDCGYAKPVAGAACSHEHGEACYVTRCVHVHGDCGYEAAAAGVDCDHQHDGECGYAQEVAEVPCSCGQDKHTEECTYAPAVPGTDCTHTHGECSYAEAREEVPCGHDCSEDEACSKKILNCAHEHGEDCGFREAAEGKPCDFVCRDCAAEAADAAAVEEVNALIEALPSLEAVKAMGGEDQQAAYAQLLAASDAYEKLTESQKAQLPGAEETFGVYFAYFSSLTLEAAEDETIGGTCGNNLTWSLDPATGELKISGYGNMVDYNENPAPWADYKEDIKSIRIGGDYGDDVRYVSKSAFYNCSNATSIFIADTVLSVGHYAFAECQSVSQLTLGNGILRIEEGAFNYVKGITSLEIPDSVGYIGKKAFQGCQNLAELTLSENLLYIGGWAFSDCALTSLEIPEGTKTIGEAAFFVCGKMTSISLPDSLQTIEDAAFSSTGLTSLTIPAGVTSIGSGIIRGCPNLTSIRVDAGNTAYRAENNVLYTYDDSTLVACPPTKGGTYVVNDQTSTIGSEAFSSCSSLAGIVFPAGLTEIGEKAFAYCRNLTSIQFQGDAPAMGNAFSYVTATAYYPANNATWTEEVMQNYGGSLTWVCTACKDGHTEVTDEAVPATCTEDGLTEGSHCSACGKVFVAQEVIPGGHTVENGICTVCRIYGTCGDNLIWRFNVSTGVLTIDGTGEMCDYELDPSEDGNIPRKEYWDKITSVRISEGVTSIGEAAFFGLSRITNIFFADSIEKIGAYAFVFSNLERCVWPQNVLIIPDEAFNSSTLSDITIPDGVTSIGSAAFQDCLISRIEIPGSVTTIQPYAFNCCFSLQEVIFHGNAPTIDNCSFDGVTATVYYPANDLTWTEEVMQGYGGNLTWVCATCKDGHTEVTDKAVPATCTEDGLTEGKHCSVCKEVLTKQEVVPSPGHTEVTDKAVPPTCTEDGLTEGSHCSACGKVFVAQEVVPGGHTVENGICTVCQMYGICGENVTWTLVDGVLTISGQGTMEDYEKASDAPWYSVRNQIEAIVIADGITRVGNYAFSGWYTDVSSLALGNTLESIGKYAFYSCSGFTGTLTIPDSVVTIEDSAFFGCNQYSALELGSSVKTIESSAFIFCTGLTGTLIIPDSVQTIGVATFQSCGGITSVTFGSGLKTISNQAFQDCEELAGALVIPGAVESIGFDAFRNDHKITSICFGENLAVLGDSGYADNIPFFGCDGVTEVTFNGTTVPTMHGNSFIHMSRLKTVWVPAEAYDAYVAAYRNLLYESVEIRKIGEAAGEDAPEPENSCGASTYWSFDAATGVLTIGGTGTMRDFSYTSMPWNHLIDSVTKIVVEEGVTRIGNNAFMEFARVLSVELPDTLNQIGDRAFYGCEKLGAVILPDSVAILGQAAFAYCEGMTSLQLSGGLTTWGESVFYNCTGLTEVEIPDSLDYISDAAFYYCNKLVTVTVPDTVRSIGDMSFHGCEKLKTITIPESVTSIGIAAFWNCDILDNVIIPDSVTDLGSSAFAYCNGLKNVTVGSGITVLREEMFAADYSLESIIFRGKAPVFEDNIFRSVKAATAYYPEDDSTWTEEVMQTYGGNITWEAYAKAHVHEFSDDDICECGITGGYFGDGLLWTLEDGVLTVSGTGDMPSFAYYSSTPWYSYRTAIESVVIENAVTSIGTHSFEYCMQLTSVEIGSGITRIESYAFDWCESLRSITFTGNAPHVAERTFYSVKATAYYPGEDATWTVDVKKHYGGSLFWRSIGDTGNPKGTCGDKLTWEFLEGGTLKVSGTGEMYDFETAEAPWAAFSPDIQMVILERGAESIGNNAFYRCGMLTDVSIPDTVVRIGDYAFLAAGLPRVSIPDSVKTIGAYAFDGVELTSIVIPDSVTSIGKAAFAYCTSLTSVTLSDNITQIAPYTFENCEKLTSVAIPKGVASIGEYAFAYCDVLKTVTLQEGLREIGKSAFARNEKLQEMIIPEGVTSIGDYAFEECLDLRKLVIPDSVKYIGELAFRRCPDLTNMVMGKGVETIADHAFYFCTTLPEVTIPANVVSIGKEAFGNCTELKRIAFECSACKIADNAFSRGVVAVAYYPGNDPTWTEEVRQNYGGIITWKAYCPNGHTVVTDKAVPATCTEDGLTEGSHCSACKEVLKKQEVVPSPGHTVVTDKAIPATCTEDGLTEGSHCSVCSEVFTAQEVVPAGHSVVNGICTGCREFGTCGDDLTWTLERGVLTVFGTGAMTDYAQGTAPWYSRRVVISEIVLNEGLTSIGSYAFDGITAIAHYPGNDPAWTEAVRQNYGGSITWIPLRSIGEDLPLYDPQEDTQQKEDVMEKEEIGCQSGHSYRDPAFVWGENDTCTAVFVCRNCDDTRKVVCDMTMENEPPTGDADGRTTYTARAVFGGREYTDSRSYIVPAGERVVQKVMPLYGEVIIARGECSHSFTKYTSDGNATCELDGSKTAVCDQGCGESHTLPDPGSRLEHQMEGGNCALCGAPDEKAASDGRKVLLAAALGVSCVAALAVLLMRRKKK